MPVNLILHAFLQLMMSDLSEEFTPSFTRWLFDNGASLVFLDLPAGSEFGIDYNCYETGAQFKGVKMIPPGIHFVYYRYVEVVTFHHLTIY
jgi:hypothetical protein